MFKERSIEEIITDFTLLLAVVSVFLLCLYLKNFIVVCDNNRVFHSLFKVGRNGIIVFKGFNNSKKKVTSSGARPGARDYYWCRSPMAYQPN